METSNAAAMREALERCNELFRCDDDNKSRLCNLARKADEATQAALAAPPRNCDRYPNVAQALGEYPGGPPIGEEWDDADWMMFLDWFLT